MGTVRTGGEQGGQEGGNSMEGLGSEWPEAERPSDSPLPGTARSLSPSPGSQDVQPPQR